MTAGTGPNPAAGGLPFDAVRRERRRGIVCAALDLGTNNCRLLIARPNGPGFRVVDAFSRIVRLGEGVAESGRLTEDAMRRTIDALKVCAAKIRRREVARGRYVGTAACRGAENCSQFVERVRDETGIEIETITAEEEARLTLAGCLPLIDRKRRHALVFDIGGGSTELMWLTIGRSGTRMTDWISLPFGVVSLTERYGHGPFDADRYGAVIEDLQAHLEPFCRRHGIAGLVGRSAVQMLGASGTVTTLAGMSLGLARYDRSRVDGSVLAFDAVHRLAGELRGMSVRERAGHPCIGRERADMMVAGCAILEAMCRQWPVGSLRVADRGLREGILVELMRRGRQGGGHGGA